MNPIVIRGKRCACGLYFRIDGIATACEYCRVEKTCIPAPKSLPEKKLRKQRKPSPKSQLRKWCQEATKDIPKDECSNCLSDSNLGFHHDAYDYRDPFIGRVLCWSCHRQFHNEIPYSKLPHILPSCLDPTL